MRFVMVIVFALLFSSQAFAQTFNTVLTDLDGKPIQQDGSDLTLARVSVFALTASLPSEQNLSGEEKVKRFAIAVKIQGAIGTGKDPELDVKELAALREQIGKVFTPIVVGRAWELLDRKVK